MTATSSSRQVTWHSEELVQGARTRRNCDEAPAGPGSPCRPCGPVCPTCPCGPASPLAPVSPFGPCGPGVGWPHPAIIVAIANARIMTAARIESTPCSFASTAQTLNETSIWRTRSPAMRQVNVCLNDRAVAGHRTYCLVGFHSRASFCASAICAGVMSRAIRSRKVAAPSLPCAADKLNHMYALTWSCGTPKPLS